MRPYVRGIASSPSATQDLNDVSDYDGASPIETEISAELDSLWPLAGSLFAAGQFPASRTLDRMDEISRVAKDCSSEDTKAAIPSTAAVRHIGSYPPLFFSVGTRPTRTHCYGRQRVVFSTARVTPHAPMSSLLLQEEGAQLERH